MPHTPGSMIAQAHEWPDVLHPPRKTASQAAATPGSLSKKAIHSAPYWLATTFGQPALQVPIAVRTTVQSESEVHEFDETGEKAFTGLVRQRRFGTGKEPDLHPALSGDGVYTPSPRRSEG